MLLYNNKEYDMLEPFKSAKELLESQLNSNNQYTLQINDLNIPISVHTVTGEEALNKPWRYEIIFTSIDKIISPNLILNQKASFTFEPHSTSLLSQQVSSLIPSEQPRTLYGVITEFGLISVNKQEARYKVILKPRLALLELHNDNAIYQNQSVIEVIEQTLRKHQFTGIDYRLELHETYPIREFITQWQESDLAFIQRLLADIGVWFCFETNDKHKCEVMVISDSEQGHINGGSIVYKQPSGTVDNGTLSIWDLQQHSKSVTQSVLVKDYNYRESNNDMLANVNSQPNDSTTVGIQYLLDQHYKQKDNKNIVETGSWYAKIRHQQYISEQNIIKGKTNQYHLAPGQHITLLENPLETSLSEGLIILSTQSQSNRTDSYYIEFTAMPFNLLKPYRPPLLPMPKINGTLPATITSPDNDTYGYIDTHGRYRVKFNFDLKTWKNGEESLWLRLAKPYSGDTYGFHFPLIDGTSVAVAFTNGNPNRPYIAHAMHDSSHPDHVSTANKHRNVIRTPANNKLRMDDKRGQEHIKLATEYGKTQLNLGHLVNNNKEQRGEGFELRTDEWGTIAANKGLYLTTQTEARAQGKQLDMQGAIAQLESALSIAKALQNAAIQAQAHPTDTESQSQLKANLSQLTESGILAYAQEGIALTSPENIQLSSGNSVTLAANNQTDINALNNITLSSGEAIGLFAHKNGIKLLSNQGNVEVQAQNSDLSIAAKQDIKIDSVDSKVALSAVKDIELICGGSYIKINSEGITLGTAGSVSIKSAAFQKMGPAVLNYRSTLLSGEIPKTFTEQDKRQGITLYLETDDGYPIPTTKYQVRFENGEFRQGRLDREGKVVLKHVPPNMDYYYQFPDDDDIISKANAQRLNKAIKTINSEQIIGYLAYSKTIVHKTIEAYKEIYDEDMIKAIYLALGPFHKDKKAIDYLFAKANIKRNNNK